MKLHFLSVNDYSIQQLADALSASHEISSGSLDIDDSYDGLVVDKDTVEDASEVVQAKTAGVSVYSVPELLYKLSEDKQRIVITGSHGKTSIASYLVHVLLSVNKEVDYFISNKLSGHSHSVHISDAPLIIIEGSADHCSGFDHKPQFLALNHHMALITQLSHELKDKYPSYDEYVKQFDKLADSTPKGGTVIYCEDDDLVMVIGGKEREDVRNIPYSSHPGQISNGSMTLTGSTAKIKLKASGDHDLQNIGGALALVKRLSISEDQFYNAIAKYESN